MSHIRVLPKEVAEKIAAGEVVERPASAVKELRENALDAGASAVTLEIQNGGVRFIRVADNGCGIPAAEVKSAFLRHATSKVAKDADLEAIGTLGFRGEALASIAAVARVELITRTAEETEGTRIALEGGEVCEQTPAGCPTGTTVLVRDLFFNTPARMKFLKKDATEAGAVRAVAERLALSHPEVAFKFIKDGKEELHTPGDSQLLSAVYAVLGRDFAQSLLPVDYEMEGIAVTGFVTKPVSARANRSMQFFFVNGRLVQSRTAMAAIEQACRGSVMVGRFPGAVLHVALPCTLVDVNVHPAKTEVRFADEHAVFNAVYYAVKTAVAEHDPRPSLTLPETSHTMPFALRPAAQLHFSASQPQERPLVLRNTAATAYTPERPAVMPAAPACESAPEKSAVPPPAAEETAAPQADAQPQSDAQAAAAKVLESAAPAEHAAFAPTVTAAPQKAPLRLAGQCFGTYLIIERGDTLYLIDKHAAHERILYEEIRQNRVPSPSRAKNISPSRSILTPCAARGLKSTISAVPPCWCARLPYI